MTKYCKHCGQEPLLDGLVRCSCGKLACRLCASQWHSKYSKDRLIRAYPETHIEACSVCGAKWGCEHREF